MSCIHCGFESDLEKEHKAEGKDTSSYHYCTCYGHCPNCTPKKLNEMISDYQDSRIDAGREFESLMAPKRKAFIIKKSAKYAKKVLKLYNSKRPADVAECTDVNSIHY